MAAGAGKDLEKGIQYVLKEAPPNDLVGLFIFIAIITADLFTVCLIEWPSADKIRLETPSIDVYRRYFRWVMMVAIRPHDNATGYFMSSTRAIMKSHVW